MSFGVDLKTKRSLSGVDPSKRVGKAEIPSLETELLAAEESLNDISREIEFARKQEILLTQATGKSFILVGFDAFNYEYRAMASTTNLLCHFLCHRVNGLKGSMV